jgi:YHS domain-containing protein
MDVDLATAPKSVFKGKTYYFCSDNDKKTFDAAPDKFVAADKSSEPEPDPP